MKIFEIHTDKDPTSKQMYFSIHDSGHLINRTLYIDDERGGKIELRNEEIGELYKHLKPPLAGR